MKLTTANPPVNRGVTGYVTCAEAVQSVIESSLGDKGVL